jgi:hypothetical protein
LRSSCNTGPQELGFLVGLESDGIDDTVAPEPHVAEPPIAIHGDDEDHVRTRQHDRAWEVGAHAPLTGNDLESHGAQGVYQDRVLFETVATTAAAHELVLKARQIELDGIA